MINQWRSLATVATGDFAALRRSALLSEAKGAASLDKFST
jgi:hypothetical protein